jgi:hypothetical protein
MNAFGGEDRFWMGPEGGQFAIFFPKGSRFEFASWQTPPLIDTDVFDVVSYDSSRILFRKSGKVSNYQGFEFKLDIEREIKLLPHDQIEKEFGIAIHDLDVVCFQSSNTIINKSDSDWKKESGLISIWILGMFNPSPSTTIVIPSKKTVDRSLITTNYFGDIPSDRIVKSDSVLMFKGDGKFRGKIGIAPSIAKPIVGSYAAEKKILTLVKFAVDPNGDYVNSKWEVQEKPFQGDAVNSYNDGPLVDGSQMGPFYEIESSSPAKALKKGERVSHKSITLHIQGSEELLGRIAEKTLGVSLDQISQGFRKR